MVLIHERVDVIEDTAGVKLRCTCKLGAPRGVAGRNGDNTMVREVFGWEPDAALREGMGETYASDSAAVPGPQGGKTDGAQYDSGECDTPSPRVFDDASHWANVARAVWSYRRRKASSA